MEKKETFVMCPICLKFYSTDKPHARRTSDLERADFVVLKRIRLAIKKELNPYVNKTY